MPDSQERNAVVKDVHGNHFLRDARWTYTTEDNGSIPLVPEFVMLGSDDIRKAIPLDDHVHHGCFEFAFVERGIASWELEGTVYKTQAGDVFHARPGELHRGGFSIIEPCKLWWMILTAPHHDGWLRLPPGESRWIEHSLEDLPRVVQIGFKAVESFKQLRKGLEKTNEALRGMMVRHAIHNLLLQLLQPTEARAVIAEDLLRKFDLLIARMEQEPEWRPSVQELADAASVSQSHFYHTFQEYTGQPPITFIERLRIKEACRKLAETRDSVTDISHSLGYPSSQHFATVFKRFMGVTPTQWRNRST
ncbi:helix-turn-helix domain-containing protein [Paenibacillus mendelii]|uniref:Helix-turn-helix domain-containing protein n=1 Tax=Paenibacillus mendelii TaxID=206163 RepID=A0ABV6J8R0_9BACL|nr:AraC family transcriptional regulator [Paenibacillus mendelii]MCQ6559580.1 AraC family transcriptional regulator [Paenibacillus mendelii]